MNKHRSFIAAQHDGKPVGGIRPTTGWLPGEIIVDPHVLTWQHAYTGPATLHLGLYDTATGARVVWEDGAGAMTLDKTFDITP